MEEARLKLNRREFVSRTIMGLSMAPCLANTLALATGMKLGLVTYQWGKDWDLETLITNCEKANFAGVELRTEHAHGVEPTLSVSQRNEVKKRFADSPVVCVGYGSNQEYHSPDAAELKKNIDGTYELIKLCHDIGATGVKVKPNTLPEDVPREKTIEQIGRSLSKVGKFASDYGQKIRVEVHGRITAELPVMKAIFNHVDEPSVGVCWNCNQQDLLPPGLEHNFNLVKDRFGDSVHIREMDSKDYPYPDFFKLLLKINYSGWILLEARTEPADRVLAMKQQLALFKKLTST